MIKYGTTQEVVEDNGMCKVAAESAKKCCMQKLARLQLLESSGLEVNCDCGNRLVLEPA